MKKIRVYLTTATNISTIEKNINDFCNLRNSEDIVDIKLTECGTSYTAMVIYKIKDS